MGVLIQGIKRMDLFEALHSRRSIRQFQDREIPEAFVHRIVSAAAMAPSAGNEQPWHFVILNKRNMLDAVPAINPFAAMAAFAPLGVLVCGDLSLEKYSGFWVQDCSAAMQNLLLAAHGLGLGAVWTGIYPLDDRINGFREFLQLPEQIIPFGLALIGYPARRSAGRLNRYRRDRVHWNRW
jgi:nitroreductase